MTPSQLQAHAARVASAVAGVVGDGCVVFTHDPRSDRLRVAAHAHRERDRREALGAALSATPSSACDGWAREALSKNIAFRLRHADAARAVSAALMAPPSAAVIAPLRIAGRVRGVAVAFRDSCDFEYSADEQERVEQLAAGAAPAAAFRALPSTDRRPLADRTLEHASAAVWTTDLTGSTTYVNHACARLAGVPEADLLGEPIGRFLDVPPRPAPLGAEWRDRILVRADGSELWVSVASAPLVDDRGRAHGFVHTLVEVGERRSAEVAARLRASAYESVADFAEIALAGEDFEVLLGEALALTADALAADQCYVCEVEPNRTAALIRAARGHRPDVTGQYFPMDETTLGALCFDESRPVVVRDSATIERLGHGREAVENEVRSALAVAIGDVGFLTLQSRTPGAFADEHLAFLGLLTSILAMRWEPARHAAPALAAVR